MKKEVNIKTFIKKFFSKDQFLDKDNDLRCRVNKRAQKLYGPNDSVAKQQWIEEEFEKRRQKRMEKERRKHIVNNVLSVPGANDATTSGGADNNNGISSIVNNQMSAYYSPLPQIDTATAAKLLDFPTDLQRQLLEQLNNSMLVNVLQVTSMNYFLTSFMYRHLQMAYNNQRKQKKTQTQKINPWIQISLTKATQMKIQKATTQV